MESKEVLLVGCLFEWSFLPYLCEELYCVAVGGGLK